jgi:hypothetical protein
MQQQQELSMSSYQPDMSYNYVYPQQQTTSPYFTSAPSTTSTQQQVYMTMASPLVQGTSVPFYQQK